MTYCQSTWVSEWGYNLVYPWIAEMSTWDFDAPAPTQRLLVGTLRADGSQHWYEAEGYAPQVRMAPHTRMRLTTADGTVEVVGAQTRWERTDDLNVIVPLPDEPDLLERLTALSWIDAQREVAVDPAGIVRIGGPGGFAPAPAP